MRNILLLESDCVKNHADKTREVGQYIRAKMENTVICLIYLTMTESSTHLFAIGVFIVAKL